jgi:hypothetical protein
MSPRAKSNATVTASAKKETAKMNAPTNRHRPRRLGLLGALAASVALLASATGAAPASAEFGFQSLDFSFADHDYTAPTSPFTAATQAGSHPGSVNSVFELNTRSEPALGAFAFEIPDGNSKNLTFQLPPGLVGKPDAVPHCNTVDFLSIVTNFTNGCPARAAVGVASLSIALGYGAFPFYVGVPVYSLEPAPGVPARLGFTVISVPIAIDVGLKQEPPYNLVATASRNPEGLPFYGSYLSLWGNPSDPAHDPYRGSCINTNFSVELFEPYFYSEGNCSTDLPDEPFLTLPSSCEGPQTISATGESWQNPGVLAHASVLTHDFAEPPNPQGFTGCGKLGFAPEIESQTTTDQAETGTGMDFNLDFNDEGITSNTGLAESTAKKVEVTLPEGVTINPSIGEGLGVCTPAQIDRETLHSLPGEGCPNSSKVGTLHLETPLVDEGTDGSVFLAQQDDPATAEPGAENPFDTLIALYLVLRNTNLGVIIKQPVKVEPDPVTGRLVATTEDVPQFPFSHFNFHFKEGVRAALVTPSRCGTYQTKAVLTPWANPSEPRTVYSSFDITSGQGGGPCPPGGIPPFNPDFEAGAENNNAGSFSPFDMRLIRHDGEQDMTKFSSVLPPGELGSLAGVDKCPDSAIAAAKAKQGREELASPSCPANSLIGHTLAGAGVGSALTYVGGQIYLGGPYHGDPLSVISITPAVAGPFDAGTVVVRLALTLNPKTAEVEVDGAASDPIPHILKGIVLKVRDLRVHVDRPNFTLNPTSCDESSAKARLFGSYLNVLDPADDVPVDLATRYQAANCLNLGFKPHLGLKLKGGTKRGGHPGLKAIYTPRKGDANIEGLVVRLPRSAFLDQAHIRTICTRVQFAAEDCPKAAQYGYIRAWTPLLDEPLQGPVWLRSSNHKLPDLVFDLHGLVDIEVAIRIDSARGGIRATLTDSPDAPLSRVILRMQGAKKGLIINSRDLCIRKSRANVQADGHNGRRSLSNPIMRPLGCAKHRRHRRHGRAARVARRSAAG